MGRSVPNFPLNHGNAGSPYSACRDTHWDCTSSVMHCGSAQQQPTQSLQRCGAAQHSTQHVLQRAMWEHNHPEYSHADGVPGCVATQHAANSRGCRSTASHVHRNHVLMQQQMSSYPGTADIPANDYVLMLSLSCGWSASNNTCTTTLWDISILYPQHTENNGCVIASTPSVSPVVVHNLEC